MTQNCPYKVYKLTCIPNGKVYIGITKRYISKRMKQHRKLARRDCSFLISRAIKKHGWKNFRVEVLADDLNRHDACQMEIDLISKYRACYENGYNMTTGGQTGISPRQETKHKRSLAGKISWQKSEKMQKVVKDPERNRKIGEHSRKMHRDPEYRANFLSRHKDMIEASRDPECRERAKETLKENGFCTALACSNGMQFDSIAEAADWVCTYRGGKSRSKRPNIVACVEGRKKTAYGYSWKRI